MPEVDHGRSKALPEPLRGNYTDTTASSPYEMACVAAVLASDNLLATTKQNYLTKREALPIPDREVSVWIPFAFHHFLNKAGCDSRRSAILAARSSAVVYQKYGPLDAVDLKKEPIGREMEAVLAAYLRQHRGIRSTRTHVSDPSRLRVSKHWGDLTYVDATSAASAFARLTQAYFTRLARIVIIWMPMPDTSDQWLPALKATIQHVLSHPHVSVILMPPVTKMPRDAQYIALQEGLKTLGSHPRLRSPYERFVEEVLAPFASRNEVFHGRWVNVSFLEASKKFIRQYAPFDTIRHCFDDTNDATRHDDNHPPAKRPYAQGPGNRKQSFGGPSAPSE
ncbi:hypothetical protein AAVH_29648 [Aphelenchoides avenae]|nr:hypothetical protein AAVH_29648 [Aphelenchus avenae]